MNRLVVRLSWFPRTSVSMYLRPINVGIKAVVDGGQQDVAITRRKKRAKQRAVAAGLDMLGLELLNIERVRARRKRVRASANNIGIAHVANIVAVALAPTIADQVLFCHELRSSLH